MADKKRDKKASGKSFMERILEKIPEDKRTVIAEAMLTSDEVLELVGDGVLKQEEFSRLANETTEAKKSYENLYNQNLSWREQNIVDLTKGKAAADELERIKKQKRGNGEPDDDEETRRATPPDLTGFVKAEDLDSLIQKKLLQTEESGLEVIKTLTRLSSRHMKEFDEALDPDEVITVAREKRLALPQAYDLFVSDRREKRSKEKYDKEIKEAEARGEERARTAAQATPWPLAGEPGLTTLSGLNKDKKKEFGVDSAVRHMMEGRRKAVS